MADTISPKRRPRGRSPAYPAIDLGKAVQRVRQLYDRDRQFPIPVDTVAEVWGYAGLNGPASLTVSALKKFGLVEDEGSKSERTVAVTDLAVRLLNHPDGNVREAALKEAALSPQIHAELWNEFGADLPSAANLEWRLTRERGFTETGAREFLREYRATLEIAGLSPDVDEREVVDEPQRSQEPGATPTPEPERPNLETEAGSALISAAGARPESVGAFEALQGQGEAPLQNFPIPVALGKPPVTISGSFPVSSDEWKRLIIVLEAMRPALVRDPDVDADSEA